MTQSDWDIAKQIFQEALEEDVADRGRFLAHTCGENSALRVEVERLLTAHDDAGSFLKLPTDDSGLLDQSMEKPGDRIGPYKLLQLIGEGGFGVVYMAEQERPIRRRVALKIIKPGMDTKEVIGRFETERQALALMDHPNIAKVLDAGATESGRPYFVMELVKGVALTDYCDANHLNTRERLELLVHIANAVHHAHERGIIHRDIKPSNVMVTLHDGTPVPKIIDFGVAKAMSQRLTEKTLFTAYGACIGTPTYMSPEQAEMSGLDVDRRTDIYSLGVLLYELLTGTTPFPEETLRSAAFVDLLKIIREQEPPTPSARLSTLGSDLTSIAHNRHAEPHALRKVVRGDLDWIVMKAIEKDRRRRYDSAAALAADVTRYFSDEPVTARRPSTLYRARKFAKRRRAPLASAAGIVGALMVGGILAQFGPFNPGARELLAQDGPGRTAGGFVARRLLTYPARIIQQFGSMSADGRFVTTFDWNRFGLELTDVATGDVTLLNEGLPDLAFSVFSPDGTAVAFNRLGDVLVASVDGSGERLLFDSAPNGIRFTRPEAWSEDGSWLLATMARNSNYTELVRISYPGGETESIKSFTAGQRRLQDSADLSRDGRYIAYSMAVDGQADDKDLFTITSDGTAETMLVSGSSNDFNPVWAPDGESIVFVSDRGGSNDFWTLPVVEGRPAGVPRFVKAESGDVVPLGITTDGDLFYHVSKSTSEIHHARFDAINRVLTLSEIAGAETYGSLQTNPLWSPDGRRLAYRIDDPGQRSLVVHTLDSGVEQRLDFPETEFCSLGGWSNDGARILVSCQMNDLTHKVMWVDPDSEDQEALFTYGSVLRDVTLSPDNSTIFYSTADNLLQAYNLESGNAETVLAAEDFYMRGGILPSPDGTRLAVGIVESFEGGMRGALAVTDIATGATLRLQRPEGDRHAFGWTPDGERVLAVYDDEVWLLPPDGGDADPVDSYLDGLGFLVGQPRGGLEFHPDRDKVSFVHGGQANEIWVLENLTQTLDAVD